MTRASSPTPSTSSSDEGLADFMQEPSSYRPATPPPTMKVYKRRELGGQGPLCGSPEIQVQLVSGHPLWGHILYPAAIAMSRFLELHADLLLRENSAQTGKGKGKAVLELGAGGGLPGLVAALEGAGDVVISDFPDPSLVNNIVQNIELNVKNVQGAASTSGMGFTWGSSPATLLSALDKDGMVTSPSPRKFDLILLSDLVFNHSQHSALLESCQSLLAETTEQETTTKHTRVDTPDTISDIDLIPSDFTVPAVLCFFSHHRPTESLIQADLGILSLAKAKGWKVTRVWKDSAAGPAFPEDAGDLCIRSTVHGFAFTRH